MKLFIARFTKDILPAISLYSICTTVGIRKYKYEDQPPNNGLFYYRLKLIAANGSITYSPVQIINVNTHPSIILFPNPASSYITVENASGIEGIVVLNLLQQPVKVSITTVGEARAQLDIRHLSTCIYLIRTNETALKFVKE